jgi:amidase
MHAMHDPRVPNDTIGAFVGKPAVLVEGAATGNLVGARLAVKDVFDVAGTVTGAGNPDFGAHRAPASAHATSVQQLTSAGATVIGKTVTDELAYSLAGTNVHYGTPVNVAAPGRIPGGSSAGSAAAVAAGLADLALGTDTGGSVRIPASYCGIVGWRPTHGAVSSSGVVPLARSFDTVGVLARNTDLLVAAADALLTPSDRGGTVGPSPSVHLLAETLADAAPDVAEEIARLALLLGAADPVASGIDLRGAMTAFRALQGREAWMEHGAWIRATRPVFGPGIAARFEAASRVTDDEVAAAAEVRATVRDQLMAATDGGRVLLIPGAAGAAPAPQPDREALEQQRIRTLRLTCVAGLAGAPVIVLPLGALDGLPLGIGLLGAPGSDRMLLQVAHRIATHTTQRINERQP